MWRNADPSSKELREESKNPHVKEYGEQQTRQDLTCEEMCRKPDTILENIWKEKGQCVLKCGERQVPCFNSRHLEERGVIQNKSFIGWFVYRSVRKGRKEEIKRKETVVI